MAKPLGLKHAAVLLLVLALAMAARMREVQTGVEDQDARLADLPINAPVDTTVCESIPDSDRHHHCLALALDQIEHCDAIQHADTQHLCRAQVTNNASSCAAIQDANHRQQCADMLRQ